MNPGPLGPSTRPDRDAARRPVTAHPFATGLILALAAAVSICAVLAALAHATARIRPAAATHTIAEVQGVGASSPYEGAVVTVEGVVTADHRLGGYDGVYLQSVGSGGDTDRTPGASDGVFVYLGEARAAIGIGDLVRVTGPVREYRGLTEISASAAGAVGLVTAGVGVPAATALPDSVVGAAREPLEGMLVAPSGTYRLSSSGRLGDDGELWLSAGAARPVKATEQVRPGEAANAIAAANRANRLLLDDGYRARVGGPSHPGTQPYFRPGTVVRIGDIVSWPGRPYVLSYGFDDWRLQPVVPIDAAGAAGYAPKFRPTNPRPTSPPHVGGDVRVASFNLDNYFPTLTSQNPAARGAGTSAQFDTQQSKLVAAINGLDADVVALMEIENSVKLGKPADTALAGLVRGLNRALGTNVWAYIPTPPALHDPAITDSITTAIIYRTGRVTPVGPSMTQVDETVWNVAREPIAQTFSFGGKPMTIIANHFKSKRGDGPEPADGQGRFTAERVTEARAVVRFVGTVQAVSGSADVLLVGDFNSYAHEDPMTVFERAGYAELRPANPAVSYGYAYDGELGSLDHAFATPSLAARITGTAVWTINSPEWPGRGYPNEAAEAGTPFRSSDHDPIKIGVSR